MLSGYRDIGLWIKKVPLSTSKWTKWRFSMWFINIYFSTTVLMSFKFYNIIPSEARNDSLVFRITVNFVPFLLSDSNSIKKLRNHKKSEFFVLVPSFFVNPLGLYIYSRPRSEPGPSRLKSGCSTSFNKSFNVFFWFHFFYF